MSCKNQLTFVTVAIIWPCVATMISSPPACAQQLQPRQKHRQQHRANWQSEVRKQPHNERSWSGNNSWRRGLWTRMSDEERDHIYSFIETNFPRMLAELEHLRNANPRRFENRMNRVVVDMQQLMEIVEIHPHRGSLRIQERKLEMELRFNMAKYRRIGTDKKKHRIASKMEKLIGQIFDTQTQRQELEVRELKNRLAELTQQVKQRQAHRRDFIKTHLDRIRNNEGKPDRPPEHQWLGRPDGP